MLCAIVQARMGSRRFPGKVLEDLHGKPVIQHLIDTLQDLKNDNIIDEFIIATPDTEENKTLWKFLANNNIKFFKGSNEDVLDRFFQCAKLNKIDEIVRVCADTPLLKKHFVKQQIENFKKYDEFSYGNGVWVFSFRQLEESWKNDHHPEDREHVVTSMFNSIDYPDDLEKVRNILNSK